MSVIDYRTPPVWLSDFEGVTMAQDETVVAWRLVACVTTRYYEVMTQDEQNFSYVYEVSEDGSEIHPLSTWNTVGGAS